MPDATPKTKKPRKPTLYAVNGLLASGVLAWALHLSAGDRGPIDWVVFALVLGAIAWNVVRLGQRLFAAHGGAALWHLLRTLLFWIVGLMNTVWARPEDVGGWRTWVGAALLVLAAIDSVVLLLRERRIVAAAT